MSGWSHTWWSKLGCLWNFYLHYFPLGGRAVFIETELATEIWRQINHCPLWEICSGRHAEPSLLAAHAAVCRADNRKHWVIERRLGQETRSLIKFMNQKHLAHPSLSNLFWLLPFCQWYIESSLTLFPEAELKSTHFNWLRFLFKKSAAFRFSNSANYPSGAK